MVQDIVIHQPDVAEITTQMLGLEQRVAVLEIKDQDTYDQSGEYYKLAAEYEKGVKALCKDAKAATHAAHKAMTKMENGLLKGVVETKNIINSKRIDYENKMAEIRRKEQAEAEAKAKALAEEERLKNAEILEEQGRPEEAQAILEDPIVAEPVVVEQKIEKTPGMTTVTKHEVVITSMPRFLTAVASNPGFYQYVTPNMGKLNKLARDNGKAFAFPGCIRKETKSSRATGK